MTLTSYNGWPASRTLSTRPLVVAGESFVPGILDDDDVFVIFQYVAQQMHERVEPIVRDDWHQMDDWGYSFRLTTQANSLSCHSSGTAIDYNATRHPFAVPTSRTFTPEQIREIHNILAEVQVVEWGGDWDRPDAMHFEISGNRAEVAAAADRIRNKTEEDPMADEIIDRLERLENKADRALGQNSRIIEKLNKSRDRELALMTAIEEIESEVEPGSKLHVKIRTILTELRQHEDETSDDADAPV